MTERTFTIKNKLGLHARPAALFVQTTNRFKAQIKVFKGSRSVDGKSIMGIMMLAAECGTEIRVVADGEGENEALKEIEALIERRFDEE